MRKLEMKPSTFSENMKMLSNAIGVSVEELETMNPINFGEALAMDMGQIRSMMSMADYEALSRTFIPARSSIQVDPDPMQVGPGPSVLEQRVRQLEINSSVMYGRIEELEKQTAALTLLYIKSH